MLLRRRRQWFKAARLFHERYAAHPHAAAVLLSRKERTPRADLHRLRAPLPCLAYLCRVPLRRELQRMGARFSKSTRLSCLLGQLMHRVLVLAGLCAVECGGQTGWGGMWGCVEPW